MVLLNDADYAVALCVTDKKEKGFFYWILVVCLLFRLKTSSVTMTAITIINTVGIT